MQAMQQLQKELGSLSLQVSCSDLNNLSLNSPSTPTSHEGRQARVLCDYDSQDPGEMSLMAGEVISIIGTSPGDPDYVQAVRGHKTGKIPTSYLEIIDD